MIPHVLSCRDVLGRRAARRRKPRSALRFRRSRWRTSLAVLTATLPALATIGAFGATTSASASTGIGAGSTIQAESDAAQSGTTTQPTSDVGGGIDVSGLSNGDWLEYDDVDFGTTPVGQFSARVASGAASGVSGLVEVHLDSESAPSIGSFAIASTGGWQTWQSVPANISPTTGAHTVFLEFASGQPASFVSLNWFTFPGGPSSGSTPTPTPTITPTPTPTPTPSPTPTATLPPGGSGGPGTFPLTLVNNTGGAWSAAQIYVTTLGQATPGQWYYLKPDGTIAHINHNDASAPGHLTKNGVNYPNMSFTLAQASTLTIPTDFQGTRVYISLGSPMYFSVSPDDAGWGVPNLHDPNDPNTDVYFDWYEFTYDYGSIPFGGNTTQVDQFGFPMTARLQQASSGFDKTVGITLSRAQVMNEYNASVAPAFQSLENQYRIVAPRSANSFGAGGANADYLQSYINQVWAQYTTSPFTLTRLGDTFTGQVVNGQLRFSKDGVGGYVLNEPTSADVFQCNGALASPGMNTVELELGAEFCAAFNRGVAEDTSRWYTPSDYYTGGVKNDYAAFFHSINIDHLAYGFPYDDVNLRSSVAILSNSNPPSNLTLTIGW